LPPRLPTQFATSRDVLDVLATVGLVSRESEGGDRFRVNTTWNPDDPSKTAIWSEPASPDDALNAIRKDRGQQFIDQLVITQTQLNHLLHWGVVAEFRPHSGIKFRYAVLEDWKQGISASEENPGWDVRAQREVFRPKHTFNLPEEAAGFACAQIAHAERGGRLPAGTLSMVLNTYPDEHKEGVPKPTSAQREAWRVRLQNLLPGLWRHNGKQA
jgi:hypothetical protein